MASGSISSMFTSKVGDDIEAGSSNTLTNDMERKASLTDSFAETMPYKGYMDGDVADIDKWAGSLERILEEVPQYMCRPGHPGRISRIPENLREIDVKAYEPYVLSIGPYHNGKPRLEHMEKRKHVVLKVILKQKPELTLRDYLEEVGRLEPAVRSFYSDVDMDSEKFVQMMLLDSLFILTTFFGMPRRRMNTKSTLSENREDNQGRNAVINANVNVQTMVRENRQNEESKSGWNALPRLLSGLFYHDLFLLENQIPFFFLQKMHTFVYGGPEKQVIGTLKVIVGNMLIDYTRLDSELVISPKEEVHHLLHLCHMFFRGTLQHESTTSQFGESSQIFRLGSAMQLYECGVSFVAKSDSIQHSLLDITFSGSGKMSVPCLYVDDNTNSLLRNLIALEQMKYPSMGLHVSAYAVLLLHLVTTPEDVGLLRRKGIIEHHLASDKEMMYLVNRLSVGLAFDYTEDKYSLKPVFQALKSYSERKVPRWRAWLKHRHCNNPWTAISLLAASLLLFLCALQTYYTVYSYYHLYFGEQS